MSSESRLTDFRRVYAELVVALAGGHDPRLVQAFATVARERFLPPGPWQTSEKGDRTPSADPAFLYHDMGVGIDEALGVPNELPSLHARCIGAVGPGPGERVVHVGAGTGYYGMCPMRAVGTRGPAGGSPRARRHRTKDRWHDAQPMRDCPRAVV